MKRDAALSKNAAQFADNDVDYVKGLREIEPMDPKLFYKGASVGWSAINKYFYAMDLRIRIVNSYLVREGSQADLARRFKVSERWLQNLLRQRRETGSIGLHGRLFLIRTAGKTIAPRHMCSLSFSI